MVLPEVAAAGGTLDGLAAAVAAQPVASVALCGLLRYSAGLDPVDALVAESFAYSTLLAGADYGRWLAGRRPLTHRPTPQPLLVRREGRRLRLVLNRPDVRNAYDTGTRDALVAALRAAGADPELNAISLEAVGPASAPAAISPVRHDPARPFADLIRASAATRGRDRPQPPPPSPPTCTAPAWARASIRPSPAGRRRPDTVVRLPEVAMGLIPGPVGRRAWSAGSAAGAPPGSSWPELISTPERRCGGAWSTRSCRPSPAADRLTGDRLIGRPPVDGGAEWCPSR